MAGHEPEGEWREEWVVDGLEDSPQGRVARLELPSGRTRVLALGDLPDGVLEGDVLDVRGGADGLRLTRLGAETWQRRTEAQARLDALNDAQRCQPKDRRAGDWTLTPDGETQL